MITSIKVNNCFSFNKPVEMSLAADMRTKKFSCNVFNKDNTNILKSVVIYGPNNTGKTNFIDCIRAIKNTLLNKPIVLDNNLFTNNNICELGFNFIYNFKEYSFEFKYDANANLYLYEKMSEIVKDRYSNKSENIIFLKDNIQKKYECKRDKNLQKVLDIASTNNILIYVLQVEKFDILQQIKNMLISVAQNIDIVSMNVIPVEKTIEILKKNDKEAKKIVDFIKNADMYLDDYMYMEDMSILFEDNNMDVNMFKDKNIIEQLKLVSVYKGKKVPSLIFDSIGTKKIVALASYVIDALEQGKTLIVDELDSSLHFKITRAIISMFNNEKNYNAQLIASLHDISLLDCKRMFRKEQIWFTDKDEDENLLYSLKDFSYNEDGVRDTSDIQEKYSKGVFGAIPEPDLISTLLEVENE